MASFTWAIQGLLLGLAVSTLAQSQFQQTFDDFEASQPLQQPQQFQQPQRFLQQPQFQSQPQRAAPKIRRPQQSQRFIDPQSVSITPSSSEGIQRPQGRFPVNQQFVLPAPVTRPPVRQFQLDQGSQFVQGVQPPPVPQEPFQQQPPQVQSFQQAPPPPAPHSTRTQHREPLEPVVAAPARASRPRVTIDPEQEAIAQHQAETAKYGFKSAVTDTLSDTQHVREEVRDGLKLRGVYSYSDGYFKRTVHYEADENGYRVAKEDVEPIGDGPQADPVNGVAEVKSNVGGSNLEYKITAADISTRPQQQSQDFYSRQRQSQQQLQDLLPPQ